MRRRYQFGSVQRKKRENGPDVWVFRYSVDGVKRSVVIGSIEQYKSKASATKAAEHLRMTANPDKPAARVVTFGALIDRYSVEAIPQRYSTASSYRAWISAYIRPKWESYPLSEVQSGNVEAWLRDLNLQPKSKGNILAIMGKLFKCAMRWNLIPLSVNPMSLVEIPNRTKRSSKAPVLTLDQVKAFVSRIAREPFRTMAWLAVGMGLERSTVVGLRWRDVDFGHSCIRVCTGVVENREGPTKNEYRAAPLPLDPALSAMLKAWKLETLYSEDSDWVFASPYFGGKYPYNPRHVARRMFWPAAKAIGLGELGWQSLRRTYSSLLRAIGVDVKVQQALMRHSNVNTTLELYTDAYSDDMQKANSAVVGRMIQ